MNSTTFRVWCYDCETEVFIDNNINDLNSSNNFNNKSTNETNRKLNRKPILANQVYVADITDEETTDEEELLIGMNITDYLSMYLLLS